MNVGAKFLLTLCFVGIVTAVAGFDGVSAIVGAFTWVCAGIGSLWTRVFGRRARG